MSPTASPTPLRLLVPSEILPAEDEALPLINTSTAASPVARTLSVLQRIASPRAPCLRLRGTHLELPAELATSLSLIGLSGADDGDGFGIEATPVETHLYWGAIAAAFDRRTDPAHFLGGPAEAERVLLDALRLEALECARHFPGNACPLVEVRRTPDGIVEVALLGVWLAGPGQPELLGHPAGDGPLLVLDEAEVEGHGLREAALGLSLMAVVFSQPASAGLFDAFPSTPTPVVHESQAKVDGTPLAVKSQKLIQPGPKLYPSGLVGQKPDAPRKVIVDVQAQRAFLFVDGKLAFETPVSTASKGRVTPRGTYSITEKIRTGKRSTIYKCAMPYWNRLGESAIGMHTGVLPGYPASHGCIRLPDEAARFMFDNTTNGTTVQVVDALPATPAPTPAGPAVDASLVATAR